MEFCAPNMFSACASSRGPCTLHKNSTDASASTNVLKTSESVKGAMETKTKAAKCTLDECDTGNPADLRLHQRDEFWWTSKMSEHTHRGEGRKALKIYKQMQEGRVKPSSYTFVAALKACRSLQDLKSAKQIHSEVLASGFETDVFVGNMLVDVYAKCGSLVDARCAFEKMPHRSVVSWNAMIMGYAQMGEGAHALLLYKQMQQGGVAQDDRTFVAALKACSSLVMVEEGTSADKKHMKELCLQHVRAIHSDVKKCGCESAVFVGNILVDVYARCGSLVDARAIFENMQRRNVVSWTAMIMGYAQMEHGEVALDLFTRMRMEGVAPNDRTFVAVLKACSSMAASEGGFATGEGKRVKSWCLDQVRAIHSHVVEWGYLSAVCVGNILVDVYTKCGSLLDSRTVFEKMPHRNVVSWNSMILGYAQMEQGEEALQLFTRMQQEGVVPDDRTYVAALKACSSLVSSGEGKEGGSDSVKTWCLEKVRAIHSDVIRSGSESAVFVANMLVDVYSKCGSLVDGLRVFEKMPHRDVVSWNTMISGYAQLEKGGEALQLYAKMQQEGVAPNDRTFIAALKACSGLVAFEESHEVEKKGVIQERCLEKVRAIHADAERSLSEPAVFLGNMLVDVYAKCGSLVDARCVFEKMAYRNEVSWTAMILGYSLMEDGEEALQLFARMQREGVAPDARTFVAALKACSSLAQLEEAIEVDGTRLKKRCLDEVRGIHSDILKTGCGSDLFVGNILVDVYAKCGSLEDGRQVFEQMPQRDVVSWNAMILGYAQVEQGSEALDLYARMQQDGMVPNHRTFVGALMACGTVAGLDKGREVHAELSKTGLEVTDSFVASSLIDMYGKCGSMADAHQVFDAFSKRDIVIWNALISGYARQGESHQVFHLFQRMKEESIQPEAITFLSILTVCSHEGLVDKGQAYFQLMISSDFGVAPTVEHYTCLIDLLGRAGELHKAMAVVKSMPFPSDSVVWETLLGACRKWSNVELGREAFELAVQSGTAEAATYILMSNIYSDAQMWDSAEEVQEGRMRRRAWKQPGKSWWTDMGGVVFAFVVGDGDHPASHQIYAKLQDLFLKMREVQGDANLH